MANQLFGTNDRGVTPNLAEIGKIVKTMQADSIERHKVANNFNEKGAAVVQQGVDDKNRARGWPVGTQPPEKTTL
jgi:hypothetical protein